MTKRFEHYLYSLKNKKIAVLGMGISNRPLVDFFYENDIYPDLFDKNEDEALHKKYHIPGKNRVFLGHDYMSYCKGYDLIFKTPSMRPDLPELIAERERGAKITSEINEFLKFCPCKTFGITGSDGKSTTTTIIAKMLEAEGYKVWLGGNLGTPLFNCLPKIKEDHMAVLELSSFQLMTTEVSPNVAVITNITPNHLDIHKDFDEYIQAKKNILRYQKKNDKAVLNLDNKITKEFYEDYENEAIGFCKHQDCVSCICYVDGVICKIDKMHNRMVLLEADRIRLPGIHNIENYMAACGAVLDDVCINSIQSVAYSFKGVEHRREEVRTVNGRTFYNDSIASSPTRTKATLSTFKNKVILIAGGKDKKNDYSIVAEDLCNKVKVLILTGQTAQAIEDAVKRYMEENRIEGPKIYRFDDFEKAVRFSYEISEPGDEILLSPASTSFDRFKNFEERGNYFKEIVEKLS
ncbi:MAG: UDP-N-acetylmuramoyl-L-alanine--D-glutamate ligase [Clostridiaceae bacterium]|nr:UDP-N-acetylmuramoyl-L-alanine--D-glutamate ligase [Clostridiaceae bacterium]